jgi:hypothetical protein
VTLPNLVHPSVRRASALRAWPTEYMASKDAAFEAYVALYNAGLLNENLLPLLPKHILVEVEGMEDLPSIVQIQQRYDPWHDVAKKWSKPVKCYWKRVNIRGDDKEAISMNLILPIHVPHFHGLHYPQWKALSSNFPWATQR